ncbi:nucleotidyltransferase family protein [Pedobacter sp. L105]|uniref:nucleotidyltransferase domain-containing protein n=1 Tax=Pedobacter sp. L105 TaxID=1641871 RepID=UPI00131B8E2F|nr:nucleotidyltransferase family protein [Pedobacter sp. L105]
MLKTPYLKTIYGNEQVLLVLFSRLYFSSAQKSDVEDFITDHQIDWNTLYEIAKAHGIRSFLYYVISTHRLVVDHGFEELLKKRYQANRFKNFQQVQSAAGLIREFKERGITLIPYKGAIFSQFYYADIALRESIDIDFLIAKEDIREVEDYFKIASYHPITAVPRPYLVYYSRFFKDIVYHQPATASIEMHWRLMDRYSGKYPSYRFFSPHLSPHQIGGLTIDKLSPTYDFLAVVSNHFVKDMGIKFKYLIDMACLIHKERSVLDTTVIFSCAQQYGFEKKLSIGMELVKQFLGINLTQTDLEVLPEQLLKTPLEYPVHLSRLYIDEPKFIKRSLQLQDNFLNRIKFILRCCFYIFLPTYADINQFKLPVYCLPLLVLMRPVRLLCQVIRPGRLKFLCFV